MIQGERASRQRRHRALTDELARVDDRRGRGREVRIGAGPGEQTWMPEQGRDVIGHRSDGRPQAVPLDEPLLGEGEVAEIRVGERLCVQDDVELRQVTARPCRVGGPLQEPVHPIPVPQRRAQRRRHHRVVAGRRDAVAPLHRIDRRAHVVDRVDPAFARRSPGYPASRPSSTGSGRSAIAGIGHGPSDLGDADAGGRSRPPSPRALPPPAARCARSTVLDAEPPRRLETPDRGVRFGVRFTGAGVDAGPQQQQSAGRCRRRDGRSRTRSISALRLHERAVGERARRGGDEPLGSTIGWPGQFGRTSEQRRTLAVRTPRTGLVGTALEFVRQRIVDARRRGRQVQRPSLPLAPLLGDRCERHVHATSIGRVPHDEATLARISG